MFGLIGNELSKIFARKLTYVMLALMLVFSAAVPVLNYYSNRYLYGGDSGYQEYLQQEKDYLEDEIASGSDSYYSLAYSKASLDRVNLMIDSGVDSFNDWRQDQSYNLQQMRVEQYLIGYYLDKNKAAKTELENNGQTWEIDADAMNYYYRYGSTKKLRERFETLDTLLTDYGTAIINNDPTYVNQLNVDMRKKTIDDNLDMITDLTKSLKYASKTEKEAINEQIADIKKQNEMHADLLTWQQYRVDNMISLNYDDWKNQSINEISNSIYTLYAEPMSKEDFDAQQQDMSYEEYLAKFEESQVDASDDILLYTYALDNEIPPAEFVHSTREQMNNIYNVITIVSLFIVLIVSTIVSREYSNGTIRLLLTRPKRRWKILLSKYASVLLISAVLVALCFGVYFGATYFLYGAQDLANPILSVSGGVVVAQNLMDMILPVFAQSLIVLLTTVTFSFFLTTVFKSTVLALVLPIAVIAFSGAAFQILTYLNFFDVVSYSFLPYVSIWEVINQNGTVGYMMENFPALHISAQYGMILLGGITLVSLILSFWVFGKRNVKN